MQATTELSPKQRLEFQVEGLIQKGLAHYRHADGFRKNPPSGSFLFIPPRPREFESCPLDLNGLVEFLGGRSLLDSTEYPKDETEIDDSPYVMLDVKDGAERLNVDPLVSKINILQEGRLPYTIWPGIVHAVVFPECLTRLNLDLVGSPGMPFLCLYYGELLLDSYRYVPYAFPGWGAPSCGEIIFSA